MSPADDGLDVLFSVTLPVVIRNNKSPSLVFVVTNVSTDVVPDNFMNELTSLLESSGIVTDDADAIVSALNPNNPFLFTFSFHSFFETCFDVS